MNVDGIKCVRFEEKGGKIQERSKEKREGDEATFLSPAIQLKRLAKVGRKRPPSLVQLDASFSSSVDLCLLSNRRTGRLASKEFRVLFYASNLVILFFLNRLFAPPTLVPFRTILARFSNDSRVWKVCSGKRVGVAILCV